MARLKEMDLINATPGQKTELAPAEVSAAGFKFKISADPKTGLNIAFSKPKTEFGPGMDGSVPLLSAKELGLVDHLFARPAPNGAYVVGYAYKDQPGEELAVAIRLSENGNGVVFELPDKSRKAYFFGDVISQLKKFVAGAKFEDQFSVAPGADSVSVVRNSDQRMMTLKTATPKDVPLIFYAEFSPKLEKSPGGYVFITNTPEGYRDDPAYSSHLTLSQNGAMNRRYPVSK